MQRFLTDQLSRLSTDRYEQGPVTLEVARLPVIRIRLREREYNRLFTLQHVTERSTQQSCDQDSACRVLEIQLDSSAGSGAELRCAVDHLHILALLRMGFRQLDSSVRAHRSIRYRWHGALTCVRSVALLLFQPV